jgi:DNA repair exonuclease SbcCD ATPase subunit
MTNFDNLSRKLENLKQICYQNILPRITNIENYLSTLTERVQNSSVIVTGNLQTQKISPLNISESELVQVYNDVPKVLLKNSIIVELTAKSFRNTNNDAVIVLENDKNGKYWVIIADKNNIWLIPSINIKLHIHKIKTVEKLFNFDGNTPLLDTHFILTKPAKLSSLPNGKEWKLEEKGILEFSDPFSQIKFELPDFSEPKENPHVEIQKINQTLDNLKLQFGQSQQENINLESQIINISEIKDTQANSHLEILKINKQINSLKLQLEEFQKEKTNLELQIRNIANIRDNQANSNLEIPEINQQLDDLRLQFGQSQEKQKELESRLEKMPFLRDYAYQQDLQIDLLKVRVESLENRQI